MSFRRGALALYLVLWLFLALGTAARAQPATAVKGQLELAVPSHPVPLQGEWGFAWQRFVDPAWQQLPSTDFVTVPSSWNAATAGGKPAGANNGWGSYVLQVNCPAGQAMAIEALHQRTATRLFVN